MFNHLYVNVLLKNIFYYASGFSSPKSTTTLSKSVKIDLVFVTFLFLCGDLCVFAVGE